MSDDDLVVRQHRALHRLEQAASSHAAEGRGQSVSMNLRTALLEIDEVLGGNLLAWAAHEYVTKIESENFRLQRKLDQCFDNCRECQINGCPPEPQR